MPQLHSMSRDRGYDDAMSSIRNPWLAAFAAIAVLHLVLITTVDLSPWDTVTKVLLMPLLAGWAFSQSAPRIVIVSLAFATLGDLAMDFESLLLPGMAAFALAHVCYIAYFISRGAIEVLRGKLWIVLMYVVAAIALVAYVWSAPAIADLRIPIPVYALLLATTAATALAVDNRAGLGAALFLASDALIATGIAERPQPQPAQLWIMVLYIVGQFLLVSAIVNRERALRTRTDCWPTMPAPQAD